MTSSIRLRFVRLCLAVCLLLYGCERQYLLSHEMILQEEIKNLPSRYGSSTYLYCYIILMLCRRKSGTRASAISDPVIIDARIMTNLTSLLKQDQDELAKLIVQFLHAFVFEASLVESYEADNFILRNSDTLAAW